MSRPIFLDQMRSIFSSERSNQFLLTGNIHDLVDQGTDAKERYLALVDFLRQHLHQREHLVIRYHIGYGIRLSEATLQTLHGVWQQQHGSSLAQALQQCRDNPTEALHVLANLARLPQHSVSIIIEHADLLFPQAEPQHMPDSDRRRLAMMRDWMGDSRFQRSTGLVILLAETAASINTRIRGMPMLAHISIPLPDKAQRQHYLQFLGIDWQQNQLDALSAGMTLHDLRSLHLESRWRGETIDRSALLREINTLLHGRIGNHIDVIEPRHSMQDVLGQQTLKAELHRVRQLLATDDPAIAPVGILAAGPNGVGKTYIFSAWAASCQRIVVSLKNLRGSYFGETDRIFEQVKDVLEQLGKVIVLIDEADTQFAAPGGGDQHATEERLFGYLIRMMGDPANRGRIVWVLMTARPERLAPDIKRAGRAGLHLPVFDPEGTDHLPFIEALLKRGQCRTEDWTLSQQQACKTACQHFSAADYTEAGLLLMAESRLHGPLSPQHCLQLLQDIQPSRRDPARLQQIQQARLHCSKQSLLPSLNSSEPTTNIQP